ncbi:DUF3152 domain-containing protein [Actinacidiphila rubida]|uniref:DUF3152 domain-containing protein n=1 Tax=Actinacidiphila rubida TaxID=310780 RepID=UPI001FECF933|nr:DUF3152 domain-containing protein [Actinacidiphila rubida]
MTAHPTGGPTRGARRQSRRRRGRGCLTGLVVVAGLLGWALVALDGRGGDAASPAPRDMPPGGATAGVRPPGDTRAPAASPRKPGATSGPTARGVPATGSGDFAAAQATGARVGDGGHLLRYEVLVETGTGISPARAAEEIAGILGAPRGWTTKGAASFQLVGSGQPHDLTVRIATAGTADALCWAGIHQDTEGEYNCEVPGGVVVNLKRWVQGSPTFDGPIHDYRALIINHEMGHFLGYGHMGCPGPGRPAPVMMQQIKGLHGCVANAWPYDSAGRFVPGPPAT